MTNHDFDVVTTSHQTVGIGQEAKEKLKKHIETIEKLEEHKARFSEDIRDVFSILKSDGFDVKAIRQVLRLRKKEKEERDDELNALDTYLHALNML
jgi:uncharacterized protein (UPF0335 family)